MFISNILVVKKGPVIVYGGRYAYIYIYIYNNMDANLRPDVLCRLITTIIRQRKKNI